MTAPTREQVEEWKAAAYRHATDTIGNVHLDRDDAFLDRWRRALIDHTVALAFAAGAASRPVLDLPGILADPALARLRDWYAIGPVQRAEVETLVDRVQGTAPAVPTDPTVANVLTEEECRELIAQQYVPEGALFSQSMRMMLQKAARIGAERERERAAKWLEEQAEKIAAREPYEGDDGSANKARAWEAKLYAVAIRRGEGA